jgi:glutaredoxin
VAKNFLKDNGVEFEVIDVSQNQELAMELINKTGQTGVPVIEIDGEYIIGFDKQKLIAILGL